jgi:putative addiction module component (TIGR02574 family)
MAQATHAELLERALELPAGDRLALATELLESVEGPEDREWNAAWAAELDRRVRDLDSGAVQAVPWQQVKSEILERLRSKWSRSSLHRGARAELEAAVDWYEAKAAGLGERFVHFVDEALELIAETPDGCPRWEADARFRRAVVQRFPYLVFYRDLADRIEVVAIAHGAREPGYWVKRK